MPGHLEGREPARLQLRVSDAERHRVGEVLREAAGEGRLDLDELDERLERAYAAKTYADLVPLTADLPVAVPPPASAQPPPPLRRWIGPPAVPGRAVERHLAIMSGLDRRGVWTVPEQLTVFAVMGGARLDLREARFTSSEVVLTVHALMGGAEIIVAPDVDVVLEGIAIMGGYSGPSSRVPFVPGPNSVTVRVRGVAVWGGVSVHRKPPRGSSRTATH